MHRLWETCQARCPWHVLYSVLVQAQRRVRGYSEGGPNSPCRFFQDLSPLQAVLIIFLCQSSISGERKSAYFRTGQRRHCVTSRNLTRRPMVPSRKSARRRRRCQQSNFISRVSYTFTHPVIHLSARFTTFHPSLLLL